MVRAGSGVGAQRLGELGRSTTKAWGTARRGRGDGGELDRGEGELDCPFIEEEGRGEDAEGEEGTLVSIKAIDGVGFLSGVNGRGRGRAVGDSFRRG
jgi:hypothetical protein